MVGCNSGDKPEGDKPAAESDSNAVSAKTNSVPTSSAPNIVSPALAQSNSSVSESNDDLGPAEACERFMSLLQSGQRIGAENMLTRVALTITKKADLNLEPIGGEDATFKIGDVRSATIKNKLAYVDCVVSSKIDGLTEELKLTWLVRKQGTGWRISGVMLPAENEASPDLLSFENIVDVTRMRNWVSSDVIEGDLPPESRQAKSAGPTVTK